MSHRHNRSSLCGGRAPGHSCVAEGEANQDGTPGTPHLHVSLYSPFSLEKNSKICSRVLSAYEDSMAATVAELLLHVSNGLYLEAIRTAERTVLHVEVLFAAIDDIEWNCSWLGMKGMPPSLLRPLCFSLGVRNVTPWRISYILQNAGRSIHTSLRGSGHRRTAEGHSTTAAEVGHGNYRQSQGPRPHSAHRCT